MTLLMPNLVVMPKRRVLVVIGATFLLGLWFIWAYEPHHALAPPTATFVSAEPSGMVDESGSDLLLVTFTINNTNRLEEASDRHSNTIWVKDSTKPTEVRTQTNWSTAPAASGRSTTFSLVAGQKAETLVLAPVRTECCRVRLQYTGEQLIYPLTLKGITSRIVTKLPPSMRSRISYKFWRWSGFPKIVPDTKWKEIGIEFSIPTVVTNA